MRYRPSHTGRRGLGFIGRVARPVSSPPKKAKGLGETFDVTPMPSHPELNTPPQVKKLQVELNRYVGSSLSALVPKRVPVNGVLDRTTAFAATQVILKRAADALDRYGTAGEARALQIMLANAAVGMNDPVKFIGRNVKEATEWVGMIADQNGLPPPLPVLIADQRVLIGAGVVGALLLLLKAKVI